MRKRISSIKEAFVAFRANFVSTKDAAFRAIGADPAYAIKKALG